MKHKLSLNQSRMLLVLIILAMGSGCANASPALATSPYTLIDLGTLGGSKSFAHAINEAGQVIGYYFLAGNTSYHPLLWEGGVMTDLGTLGSNNSYPVAINEAGQVIGYAYQRQEDATTYHAFVWENGVMTELTLGGSYSEPYAINEAGQVVGTSQLAGDTI